MRSNPPRNLAVHFGWVSLFQDLGSKMVVPVVPLYLTLALGASPLVVGVIDGVAAATVALVAPWIGRLVTPGRSPGLLRLGYGLSSVAKLALVATSTWMAVLFVRVVDRAGKGIRDTPRDILLAADQPDRPASAFAVQQAMDKIGGAIGPLLGFAVYRAFNNSFDAVFVAAFIPCVLSVGLLFRRLSDETSRSPDRHERPTTAITDAQRRRIVLLGLTSAGTVPVALLIVRAVGDGSGVGTVLGAYALLRVSTATLALPGGLLADRFGAGSALALGYAVHAAALGLALFRGPLVVWVVLALVGAADALTRSPAKAWLLEAGPKSSHPPVFGMTAGVKAAAGLVAGVVAGALWGDAGSLPIAASALLLVAVGGSVAWMPSLKASV